MHSDLTFDGLLRIIGRMCKRTTMPLADIKKATEEGRKLTLEESTFSDPGPDYSAVYLEGTPSPILYIPGY